MRSRRRRVASLAACILLLGLLLPAVGRAERPALSPNRLQVVFHSGRDRVYGTLELPARTGGRRVPGVLLIAGSGSLDRNGNDPDAVLTHINTLRSIAGVLAAAGIASLRYDKLGTGRTGIGTHPNPATVGFNLYVREATAAYRYLAARPEIDPRRLGIVGHSEGGLIALILAGRPKVVPRPHALVLAAPPSLPILETIRAQIARSLEVGVAAGALIRTQADAELAEVDRIIAQLKAQGTVPTDIKTPGFGAIFNPANAKYLAQEETYDPRLLAKRLPRTLPVLLLHGTADVQVTEDDMRTLLGALQRSGHTRVTFDDLPGVDHVFKQVAGTPSPNPLIDYNNPTLPFSPAAARRLRTFLRAHLGT